MAYPPPTEKQARILWASVTALAIGVLIGLTGVLVLGMAKLASMISSVLLPLAIAGVIAYLLDPVVDWFQKKRGFKRQNSIILVFIIALLLVGGLVASVVPSLISQVGKLTTDFPKIAKKFQESVSSFVIRPIPTSRTQHVHQCTGQAGLVRDAAGVDEECRL